MHQEAHEAAADVIIPRSRRPPKLTGHAMDSPVFLERTWRGWGVACKHHFVEYDFVRVSKSDGRCKQYLVEDYFVRVTKSDGSWKWFRRSLRAEI